MVRAAETLTGWKQRMRFSSLALLRCVSSSPAAAQVALLKRAGADGRDEAGLEDWDAATVDAEFTPLVYDPTEAEAVNDAPPSAVFDAQRPGVGTVDGAGCAEPRDWRPTCAGKTMPSSRS